MNIKELTITNIRGDSIQFGRHFFLQNDFQISGLPATVNVSSSTSDGAHYQSTKLNARDIDIPFYIKRDRNDQRWIEEKRNEAYKVFNPKTNPMRIDFTTFAGDEFFIHANLESAPTFNPGIENDNKVWLKGLLQFVATDPFFYEKTEHRVDIAMLVPSFEFPLEIPEVGIEMGYRSPSLIVNVLNSGQESTGMLIRFKALSAVQNPKLLNINTYEELKLNLTMLPGDLIEVSTYRGKRSIILTRNNVISNIFNVLDLSSIFLQLEIGDNLFRYDADAGLDYLEVSMSYTPKRIGV
ncbi:phage tail family protein [Bacillus sp. CGMCC 1.16607]|uniref:phage tail family protein n=1 Tax=Bacillus sp. CGMCC 1.16607 TaxID=3351842 RepID=UPI0036320E20